MGFVAQEADDKRKVKGQRWKNPKKSAKNMKAKICWNKGRKRNNKIKGWKYFEEKYCLSH